MTSLPEPETTGSCSSLPGMFVRDVDGVQAICMAGLMSLRGLLPIIQHGLSRFCVCARVRHRFRTFFGNNFDELEEALQARNALPWRLVRRARPW